MIIKRSKYFSSSKDKKEKKDEKRDKTKAAVTGVGSAGLLLGIEGGKLTGKVTRYHNTEAKNVDSILREGLKAKYSEDPNNITNRVLRDIDMDKKRGLVYTSKTRSGANGTGLAREMSKKPLGGLFGPTLDDIEKARKNNKTLKLVFDYDELKGSPRIENPELRGAKNWQEFKSKHHPNWSDSEAKQLFKSLGEDTHIFKGDINSSHIVGGAGYKRRTLKQVKNYIKNNPKRFGKEAAKVVGGAALGGYAIKKAADVSKENKNKSKKKNDNT